MRERKIIPALLFGISIVGALAVSTIITVGQRRIFSAKGDGDNRYTLSLNSSNRIYSGNGSSGSVSGTVYTTLNNPVSLTGYNISTYSNGWQTILPNGYIYNQIDNSSDHNKISGLSSITYNGNSSLSLYYGYSLDNTSLFYSLEKTLNAGVEYTFNGDDTPSYFYIKNNGSVNVNIESLSIKYSCSAQAYPRNNLNVLMIGNSFADDTVYYARNIAASYGITLNIYDAYIGGCTINTHYSNMQNNVADYSMRSTNGLSWIYQDNMTLNEIVDYKNWDYITFQQASAEVGRSNAYTNLANLVGLVRNRVGSHPKFYWYQTWAYDHDYMEYYDYYSYFNNDQLTMFNATNQCYQSQVAPLNLFEKTIFAGTAVQNMRTSYMQDTISRDGKHMSVVHGRYLLGLNFISNLLNIDYDLSPCSYLPDEVSPSYKNVAYESIRNARKSPFAVTQSIYTQNEMANYDLSSYTEIDVGFVGNAYYDSTDPSKYFKRQGNVSGTSVNFVTTKQFTPSTLPVGSLVFCPEAFGYRPEAWMSQAKQETRPSEQYDNVLQIDSSFWNGYAYRAFNIFKASKSTLMGQFQQIFDAFKIFVPNSALNNDIVPKGTNEYAASDRAIFAGEYLNFDSFDRVHIDPIIGFYKCDSYYNLQNSYVDSTAQKFICTRPFFTSEGDLPENTIIICDSGYQWRSDCWNDHGLTSSRPNNVSSRLTRLDSNFMNQWRIRTFNFSRTDGDIVGQNELLFANHVRIYVPNTDDINIEKPDRSNNITFCASGTVNLTGAITLIMGNSTTCLFVLTGESQESVEVQVAGSSVGATDYTYNKNTNDLVIHTNGEAQGYTYGTITGKFNPSTGQLTNVSIDGTIKQYISNNGSISASEKYFDLCNYSTEAAANQVWQRWYGSGWINNTGTGGWTQPSAIYTMENDYSLGLRIAGSNYGRTRFTLRNDLNNGQGMTISGFSVWFYNPSGDYISNFRIFAYKTPSDMSNGFASPSSNSSNYITAIELGADALSEPGWKKITVGVQAQTYYNISLFFSSSSSANNYIYMGHFSIY